MKQTATLLAALFVWIAIAGCSQADSRAAIEELTVMSWGYEDSRYSALFHAVQSFNHAHPDRQYALNIEKYTGMNWQEYQERFEALQKSGKLDLLLVGHEYLGDLAQKGMIVPLDGLLSGQAFQNEYFPTVWQSLRYDGKLWGVPTDLDVQTVFVSRRALRAAGYSAAQIEALPDAVRQGAFTMPELLNVARAGTQSGVVSRGVTHRPTSGQSFYLLAQMYGAFRVGESGSLSFDRGAYEQMLVFYQQLAEINGGYLSTSWDDVYRSVMENDTAVFFGASYSIYDMIVEQGAQADALLGEYVPMLFPALDAGGHPTTISHPMVFAVSTNVKSQGDIEEILSLAVQDISASTTHCVTTYHLPVTKSVAQDALFQNYAFLMGSLYMLDYTTFLPVLPQTPDLLLQLYADCTAVEKGEQTPAQAADAMEAFLTRQTE